MVRISGGTVDMAGWTNSFLRLEDFYTDVTVLWMDGCYKCHGDTFGLIIRLSWLYICNFETVGTVDTADSFIHGCNG